MTRAIPIVFFAMCSTGCGGGCDGGGGPELDIGGDGPTSARSQPFRDDWRVIHEGRFQIADESGDPTITRLTIGKGLGYNDNFINRGDVIVQFDGPPDTIKVELRRFTFARDQADADEDYAKLQLWAYNAKIGAPDRPEDMDDDTRCGGAGEDGLPDPWLDDCGVFVYYEGLNQLQRSGADIRITLPPDYRQQLEISTGDAVAEDSYPNRGNVCVTGLDATLDVDIGSGLAFVQLASGTTPSPACPADLRADCEGFDDPATEGPDAWAAECGCFAQGYALGHVNIISRAPSPSTMTVDVPQPLWAFVNANNTGGNELAGKHCTATLAGLGPLEGDPHDDARPWEQSGVVNRPPRAPVTGFGVTLESNGCDPVAAIESPEEWLGPDDEPVGELRGDLTVCAGCLAAKTCDELLPGNE